MYKASVDSLKTKLESIKCCQCVLFVIMYLVYSFSICSLQDQLKCQAKEYEQLEEKMAVIKRTKQNLHTKLQCQDELCRQKNAEIVELKRALLKKFCRNNKGTQTIRKKLKDAQSSTDVQTLTTRKDMDVLSCKMHSNKIERSLNLLKEEISRSVGLSFTSVASQTEISISWLQLQNENAIQGLRQMFFHNDRHKRNKISVLENEVRICSKKLAEVEADYQVLKNENSILKKNLIATESRANTEIRECKNKEKQFYSSMQIAKEEASKLRREIESLKKQMNEKNTKIDELQTCQDDEMNYMKQYIEKIDEENENLRVQLKQYKDGESLLQTQVKMLENNNSKFMNELELIQKSVTEIKKENQSKDEILADYTRRIVDRSKLYNQTESIVCSIREWLDGQNELLKNLYMKLRNKEKELERLVCEKELMAFNYKRLQIARENLLQKLKRYQKRAIKKTHKCNYSRSISAYSNIKKKNCVKLSSSSSRGHTWMFPNLKYVSDNLRQLDRYYSFFRHQDEYFCNEDTISPTEMNDSDTTLVTSR